MNRVLTGLRTKASVDDAYNNDVIERMPLTVGRFYRALLDEDDAALHATLADGIRVKFPSYPVLTGREDAISYFTFQKTLFDELIFQIVEAQTYGALSAVVWRERGVSADGAAWAADGVDLLRTSGDLITSIEVGGLPGPLVTQLRRFGGPHRGAFPDVKGHSS
ncbi:nuclear transport factor 2 family protein [Kribbella sp. NPDC050124]|uniref:nuclear transport factor 2 family protein n=1 Tax=Kribbella sp. NPDC050124 TaxID=3364114 RepID=UPI0037AF12F1